MWHCLQSSCWVDCLQLSHSIQKPIFPQSSCPHDYYWPMQSNCTLTLKTPRKPASENVVCLCHLLNILTNEKMGVSWADLRLKLPKFANSQSQTRSPQYQCTHQVKIHWCLLKLSSGNEKWTDGRTTDGRTDRLTHGRPTWNHNTPPLLCGGV